MTSVAPVRYSCAACGAVHSLAAGEVLRCRSCQGRVMIKMRPPGTEVKVVAGGGPPAGAI